MACPWLPPPHLSSAVVTPLPFPPASPIHVAGEGGGAGGEAAGAGLGRGATAVPAVRTVCPVYYTFGIDLPGQRAAVLGSVQIISAEATFQTSISP